MKWLDHHLRSTKLAAAARQLLRHGEQRAAEDLYGKAASEAERAMALVPRERHVTFGVIAMLAHRLWRRARRPDDAARIAGQIRGSPELFPVTVTAQDSASPPPVSPPQKRADRRE